MAMQTVEATEKFGATKAKNQTTYNVWKNTDRTFFEEVKQDKALTKQFAGYMQNVGRAKGTSIQHLLDGFDWVSLGEMDVIDVGRFFPAFIIPSPSESYLGRRVVHFGEHTQLEKEGA